MRIASTLFFALIIPSACRHRGDQIDDVLRGTISYPFLKTDSLGHDALRDKLVIKSIKGDNQYVVEFPNNGSDYDVEIPLASSLDDSGKPADVALTGNPTATDLEMTRALPDAARAATKDARLLDKAFGVASTEHNKNAPSYSLGLAKVNGLFKAKKYEYALIELNNLLAFYPNSPKFWKMKGTIYVRINNLSLAEQSWKKALELDPNDRILQHSISQLQKKISRRVAAPSLPAQPDPNENGKK